jgi:hypothetical protein
MAKKTIKAMLKIIPMMAAANSFIFLLRYYFLQGAIPVELKAERTGTGRKMGEKTFCLAQQKEKPQPFPPFGGLPAR